MTQRGGDMELRWLTRAAQEASPGRAEFVALYVLGLARIRRRLCPRCGNPVREVDVFPRNTESGTDAYEEMHRLVRRVVGPAATNASTQEVVSRSVARLMTAAYMGPKVIACAVPGGGAPGAGRCDWNATHGWCDPTDLQSASVGLFQDGGALRSVVVLHVVGSPTVAGARARLARVTGWVRSYATKERPFPAVFPDLTEVQFRGFNVERNTEGDWLPVEKHHPAVPFYPLCLRPVLGAATEDDEPDPDYDPAAMVADAPMPPSPQETPTP